MVETNYFGGQVRKLDLPVYDGPIPLDAPTLKRMLLPQGELAQFYDDAAAIHYIAFIELRAGTVRGNHYHEIKQEFIYLLDGELQLITEERQSKSRQTLPLSPGALVVIAPGIAHCLQVTKSGRAIEFSPARFDLGDTYRYPLVV